jgi:hypothetical protein
MPRSDGISTISLLDARDVETASAHALPTCVAQPTEDDPGADDATSVWAESIRLAVDAQPAALCTRGLAVVGLLQVAFTASIAGSFVVTDDATRNNLFLAAGLLAFLMVIEICASSSATYIQNVLQDDSAYQHVENVRKAAPSIRWRIQCYHYRTEAYITTQMDGAGNKQIQNHNRQVRHNTHSAWAIYTPYYWEDISSPFPDIGSASLTRLTFEREFVFADDESRSHFRSAKQQFIHSNRKDAHYEFTEVLDTPGFQRKVLACKDSAEVPWWLSSWCYYIASALCLTIPFRFFFAWKCCEIPEYRCARSRSQSHLERPRSVCFQHCKTPPLTP